MTPVFRPLAMSVALACLNARALSRNRGGQSMIEYALIVAFIVTAAVSVLPVLQQAALYMGEAVQRVVAALNLE